MKNLFILLLSVIAFNTYALDLTHEMGTAHFNTPPQKVVALDWALAETVRSLDVDLLGVAQPKGYQQWVVEPALNSDVIDVGSRREPNLELLTELKPDVILISQHMAAAYEQLKKIAPTLVYSVYRNDKHPLDSAKSITLALGKLLNKEPQAQQVIQQTDELLHDNGEKIRQAHSSDKPLLFVRLINSKTLRIHGQGSLAQSTIDVMGLRNDWQEQTNLWGFTTTGIEKLAEHQNTNVMLLGPLKDEDRQRLTHTPLWQAMTFTRTKSVYELPPIWTFGGLIAAQRFSQHITQQLTEQ